MSVLPLVFSFLALITILAYTRLSGYVITRAVHHEYEQFLQNYQEGVQSTVAIAHYEKNKSGGGEKLDPQKAKIRAHRYLNLAHLTGTGEKADETAWILKQLITTLFSKAPFYLEVTAENPRIVDELILALREKLEGKTNFKKADLCTLELGDPKLQYFFYKLLKDPEKRVDEDDEEFLVAQEGTRILNEVIIFNNEKLPIRMFLANPALLQAIFQDGKVVEDIVEARKSYYKMVKKDPTRDIALTEEFTSRFAALVPPPLKQSSCNWQVSGTPP